MVVASGPARASVDGGDRREAAAGLADTAAGSAGAVISTTGDLNRFWSALVGGRLLRPAQLAEMQSTAATPPTSGERPGERYGLGVMWIPLSCGGYWGHTGYVPGYITLVGATDHRSAAVETTGDGGTTEAIYGLVDAQLCGTGG